MKKIMLMLLLVTMLLGLFSVTAYGAGPEKPVINNQMPDCSVEIGQNELTLFTDAESTDGGTLEYQWYSTTVNDISRKHAIDGQTGTTFKPPQKVGVVYYCYGVWNIKSGSKSAPVYSRLIRVEFYENHTHKYGSWMVTTKPTCTEAGIKVRECDCGYTERAEVAATGHKWDEGKITKEAAADTDGRKTFTCTVCKATKVETIAAGTSSGDPENDPADGSEGTEAYGSDIEEEDKKQSSGLPWWGFALIGAALVGGGIAAGVLISKKKSPEGSASDDDEAL